MVSICATKWYAILTVATYPSAGGRGKIDTPKHSSPREKMNGVATNIYLRENVRKPKRGLWILKIRVRDFLRMEKVLASHAPITRDDSLYLSVCTMTLELFTFPFFIFFYFFEIDKGISWWKLACGASMEAGSLSFN